MNTEAPLGTILVVEDNPDDVFLLKRALKKAGITHPVDVVTDGQAAMDYLSQKISGQGSGPSALPLFVLLDLKLPKANGFEVLEWLRGQPLLSKIVTIVLTSSPEESDILMAYELGARSYLIKPPTVVDLIAIMNAVSAMSSPGWLEKVELPGVKNPVR